ncbi:DUF6544 family protein [Dyadobacter pollutisoli]|uniref:Uncharacterized protein n=1 Tax=Dyadobacter pollutisoli TaxID=2910158 RepID=A0A9E8NDI5_9BACT|nr:DUF6544 family protein [Dyadobacter pollutisoli]WAC13318.1 hypothetical protein ON006_05015 [Dyadobacter pollutisoli]
MRTISEFSNARKATPLKPKQPSSATMTALLLIFIIAVIVPAAGKFYGSVQFENAVKQLYKNPAIQHPKPFSYHQLSGLPSPVQGYLKHVLKEGQMPVRSVRMLMNGQFRTDIKKDWIEVNAQQYIPGWQPGFVWHGKGYMLSSRDSYLAGSGNSVVYRFGFFPARKYRSDEGELLRWIAESTFHPTTLLPSDNIQWLPIDPASALVTFSDKGALITCRAFFNSKQEISRMETYRPWKGKKEKWVVRFSNYQSRNGMLIPNELEAGWQLTDGYFSDLKLKITSIEFNKTEIF